jgi:phosphoribosylaminoimidazolecarboxamide formyltransferase/IMP cyclohydrolase
MKKTIKTALISVYYKDGLDEIIKELNSQGVKIFSTGGTQTFIESLGVDVTPVEALTGYPSILGGRVKTLHPKVFGGILAMRDDGTHQSQLKEYGIPEIDLVIVDLYPFTETVASDASYEDIVEKIDIGGISLIRAAAKNHKDTVIIPSKAQYARFLQILKDGRGATTFEQRLEFATDAFAVSSDYDAAICEYFVKQD